jgi:hypothetical protein
MIQTIQEHIPVKYFFVRVNGSSLHSNPVKSECFVEVEQASFKRSGYSNYIDFCFEKNIVRMGWPDVGDLRSKDRRGAKSNCYTLESLHTHIRQYLLKFSEIPTGSVIVVPDKDKPGDVYICEVIIPYWFEVDGPYECSHRLGVKWIRNAEGKPVTYSAEKLGIPTASWWLRAFKEIVDPAIIENIERKRK